MDTSILDCYGRVRAPIKDFTIEHLSVVQNGVGPLQIKIVTSTGKISGTCDVRSGDSEFFCLLHGNAIARAVKFGRGLSATILIRLVDGGSSESIAMELRDMVQFREAEDVQTLTDLGEIFGFNRSSINRNEGQA